MLRLKIIGCLLSLLMTTVQSVQAILPNDRWTNISSAYDPNVMFNPKSMFDPFDLFNPLNFVSPFNIHNGIMSENWEQLPEEVKTKFRVNTCKVHVFNLGVRGIPGVKAQLKTKHFVLEDIIEEEMSLEEAMAQIPRFRFGLVIDRNNLGRIELIYNEDGENLLVHTDYVAGIRAAALIRDGIKKCSINDYQLGLPVPQVAPEEAGEKKRQFRR